MDKKSKKNAKFTTIAWVMAAMLLVIMIPLNIAASVFDREFDLTQNKMYSLTDTSKNYLSSLDKTVDVYLLCDFNEVREDPELLAVEKLFDELSQYSCINFQSVDPETHPEIKDEINPDGLMNLKQGDIVVRCDNKIKRVYADETYSYDFDAKGNPVTEYFEGENCVIGAIKSVVEGRIPFVYFLTGHGEKSLEKDYTILRQNLRNFNYETKELNLVTSDAVPEDAAIVVIPAPKKDISDAERAKLESFLDKGGNISLLMSPNDDDITYTNLENIMAQYGIGMDYNLVSETDSSKYVTGDPTEILVNLVDPTQSEEKNLEDLTTQLIKDTEGLNAYMPASRSFYSLTGENSTDLIVCPLIETYNTAEGKPYGGTEVDPDPISGLLYLGAYSKNTARNNSKLVVMGNAEFIDDENFSEGYTVVPSALFNRTITWMYDNAVDMNIAKKTVTSDVMKLETEHDTNVMMIILNAAPVITALSGILIWLKRRHA